MKILVIEDEYRLADLIRDWLVKDTYEVDLCTDGEEGYFAAKEGMYDVIIMDVMLPSMDGFTILQKLRKEKVKTQILMLTAKAELENKVFGLDAGADDYMTKPFEIEELLARIRMLTRRNKEQVETDYLSYGDLKLLPKKYEVCCTGNGQTIKLAEKEYRLLEYFILNAGQVLSKEQISVRIWGYETDVEYNSAEVYVSFIRKKLNFLESKVKIQTIRGVGYQMEERHDSDI